jgi:hypothetical protein
MDVPETSRQQRRKFLHWYVALLCSEKPGPTIHHILAGLIPEQLDQDDRDAVIEALTLWEREPAARPN